MHLCIVWYVPFILCLRLSLCANKVCFLKGRKILKKLTYLIYVPDHMGIQTILSGPYDVDSYSPTVCIWLDLMGILIRSDCHTVLVSTKQKLG